MQKARTVECVRGLLTASAFVAPLLLGACAETPRTAFDWDVNTRAPVYAHHRAPHSTPRYASSSSVPSHYRAVVVASTRSTPHRSPGWYQSTPQAVEPAQAYGPAHFTWPVQGHVILPYGPTPSGGRNDGINIAANMDAPIRAADAGTVVYAEAGPKGYGNLVLIRHGNGYITAYAHADRIAVAKGDRVNQGQVIGYAGQTGGVSAPQLHFEIRQGGKALDPRPLLTTISG
jgi:murein DD-endopeptidase MepM/ murein hydrolase activator NlpD